jgi:hypothetical protein
MTDTFEKDFAKFVNFADDSMFDPAIPNGVKEALNIAASYGQIDGAHHKAWTIDQMVRALCVTQRRYDEFVKIVKSEDGKEMYDWDEGIAP